MRNLLPILSFLLLVYASGYAQPASGFDDPNYGLDPMLYNGKFYTYHFPAGTKGSPFFQHADYAKGWVQIRGVRYTDQALKYEITNQQLILKYTNAVGAVFPIVLSETWLEAFKMDQYYFELIPTVDTTLQIFQVIGEGDHRILYRWSKELKLDERMSEHGFVFSTARREFYFQDQDGLTKYQNNKSFLTALEPRTQAAMKHYLKQHHINVKIANDQVMNELIIYYNQRLAG